ncbi:MAG: hypothetical protein IJ206_02420 [Oscillospiraceae bacterium]|nr:hypothetical protein [Oscillospiraceae bacterium]
MRTTMNETTIEKQLSNGHRVAYTLFTERFPDHAIRYGIRIADQSSGETDIVHDLTTYTDSAAQLFSALVRGEASPVHLHDIAEDFVSFF